MAAEELTAEEKQKLQYKRQNEWMATKYHRVTVTVPNELYEQFKEVCPGSMNSFFISCIEKEIKKAERKKQK